MVLSNHGEQKQGGGEEMVAKMGQDKWVGILNSIVGKVLANKITFGQRPKVGKRRHYVDTWGTFSAMVFNVATPLILSVLTQKETDGIEDEAKKYAFGLLLFITFSATL